NEPVTDAPETEPTTEFVPVDRTLSLVEDYADVLTDTEEAELLTKLESLGEANDIEVGVVTVDSYEGKDPQAFADDFYDYNGYGYGENDDGFIVVFNTGESDGNRNIAISTHGKGIDLLTDMEIDVIIEMMINPIKNGDFAGAFDNFVAECENAIDSGISIIWIPVSILIGFGLAFLIVKIQASKLKTVVQKADAADYVGNVMLTAQYDNFMYKNVTSSPKAKSSSGGSTHTSSSGRTHGGGNKSF
ncbi:MAG: TPM domain-containing protein, partial [Clostridia bacterium]|nr:TPM domain-containing protein [Clostridia bacterium]